MTPGHKKTWLSGQILSHTSTAWVRAPLLTLFYSSRKALTKTYSPISGSAEEFFVIIMKFILTSIFQIEKFLDTETFLTSKILFLRADFRYSTKCMHTLAIMPFKKKTKKTQTWRSLLLRTLRKSQNLFNKYSPLIG